MKTSFFLPLLACAILCAVTIAYFPARSGAIEAPRTERVQSEPAIFTNDDDAESAYFKIEEFRPAWDFPPDWDSSSAALNRRRMPGRQIAHDNAVRKLMLACRDYCRRFPDSIYYANVSRIPAELLASYSAVALPKNQPGGWDPSAAEHDPRLTANQRADIAFLLAAARVGRSRPPEVSLTDALFDEMVAVLPAHRGTQFARDNLIRHSLSVAPAKAIPRLREFYPHDPDVARCIRLLESIDQPCLFSFVALDGRRIDSRDYLGKVVMFEFWAKGCGPCIDKMPEMKRSLDTYGPRGLAIIGVNLDERRADAEEIVKKFELPWPQHFEGKNWQNEFAQRFCVSYIPQGVLIDRKGRLRFTGQWPATPEINKRIEALLAE